MDEKVNLNGIEAGASAEGGQDPQDDTPAEGQSDEGAEGGDEGAAGEEGGSQEGAEGEGGETLTQEQIAALKAKGEAYDHLLPEFTKKSQKLSELTKGQDKPSDQPAKDPAFYEKEDWEPKDMKELAQAIKHAKETGRDEALGILRSEEKARENAREQVDEFLESKKTLNKSFDEDDFLAYAKRHKFPVNDISDLENVYSAYMEVDGAKKLGIEKGKKKGGGDNKVNKPGAGNAKGVDLTDLRTQPGSTVDKAQAALERLKK